MKNRKNVLLITIFVVLCIPLFLQVVVFGNHYYSTVTNDAWAGFFGGYVGALIGALATIFAVTYQISYNEKRRHEDEENSKKPYLHIQIDDELVVERGKKNTVLCKIHNYGADLASMIEIMSINLDNTPEKQVQNIHEELLTIGPKEIVKKSITFDFNDTELFLFRYFDIIGNIYEQEFRCQTRWENNHNCVISFFSLEPKKVKDYRQRL